MLTALMIIGGIIDLAVGVLSLALAAVTLSWLGVLAGLGPTGLVLSLVSFGSIVAGILSFVLAYGLWKGRTWAWTWTLIFSIIGLVASIIAIVAGVGILGVVIYAIIIYYLTRARVKAFFGKGPGLPEPTRVLEPPAAPVPETVPPVRRLAPIWKGIKPRVFGLVILALLAGAVLGYSIRGPSPQPLQQATVYVTQQALVTFTSREYRTFVSYVSVTEGSPQAVTVHVTQTVTRTVPIATTTPITEGPYVVIRYSAKAADSISYSKPASGNVFLIVTVQIENHGYERFYATPTYTYLIIGNQQFTYSGASIWLSDYLPSTDVLNGLTLAGSIAYEVPAGYGAYQLLYAYPYTEYNIQYVHSG